MKQKLPYGKRLMILWIALLLSARSVIFAAAQEPDRRQEENAATPSEVLCEPASPGILIRSTPSEVLRMPPELPGTPSEILRMPPKLLSTPSEILRTPSEILRAPGISLMSSSYDDRFIAESSMQAHFQNLAVNITKNQAGNLVFEITGRVRGPIKMTSTDHNSYWGPYMGFTLHGVPGTIGMKGTTNDRNSVKKVRIAPECYHLNKTSSEYDIIHYINQTEVMTAFKGKPAKGGKLTARVSASHTGTDDRCGYKTVNIADVVSYSDNTPAPGQNTSSFFDLRIRMELANLNENVTGFYVGKYCYSYYSGQTDKNDSYQISDQKYDLSAALQSAKIGKVKLTFAPGAGSGGPGTVELKPGSAYAPSQPKPPAGHRFLRWDGWNGTVPSQAQIYYAVYEEIRYHISFEAAGGGSVSAMQNLRHSELRMLPRAGRKGYRHTGWQLR